jgi:hypothetical protein
MAGRAGRSGRKRLSVAVHLARGTYRPDRHGPRPGPPSLEAGTPLQGSVIPPIPEELLQGLDSPGREYLAELWATYQWPAPKQLLLRMMGDLVNERARAREAIAKQGTLLCRGSGARYLNPWIKQLRQVESQLLAVHRELALEDDES